MNILTFIGSFGWLGNIGYFYANMLFKLFGYLGYICFFLLAYLCHKMPHPLRRDQSSLEKSLGIILITISILTLQSLFISDSGVFGTAFNNILSPIISDLGVFILSSSILLLGILI
ncbi:MAG: DNA translocase FtsK 4TM domain-containing protein [Helicobacter sp.]|nr:DNA translocase FtsK 4TM domain-containing protein [Helicobacter sp.]